MEYKFPLVNRFREFNSILLKMYCEKAKELPIFCNCGKTFKLKKIPN